MESISREISIGLSLAEDNENYLTGYTREMDPLASRIPPISFDKFVGQVHLVGTGKPASTRRGEPTRRGPLRAAIEKKELFSFLLWGPPGSGKTTLARIYANALGAEFHELSAVDAGKEDIKRALRNSRRPTADDQQSNSLLVGSRKLDVPRT